ncbi:unnamed protein product [Linum tenue]|uniref:Transmembrane protein n=1 Tax=Linum tenue TaxID=586396 RepID=A0AAV0QI93_9ROSI|nr:unnamed protein product [Linum tenue]
MQQRQTISSRAPPQDHHHHTINVHDDDLPPYHHRRSYFAGAASATNWIHAIPAVVVLCFVILWWFSSPVVIEMMDGRMVGTHPIDYENVSVSFNANLVELAVWESMAPDGSLPDLNITAPPGPSQALLADDTTHG